MSTTADSISVASATRIDRDIAGGSAALAMAEIVAPLLGPGAHAGTRVTIHVQTTEEVDKAAAKWRVTARWDLDAYVASVVTSCSHTVVMFIGPDPKAGR